MTLSDEELERYARHIVLKEIGGAGQLRLKSASVTIIGAGGIGSPAIQYLAAAGVGLITLIDDDLVGRSNLQRQTIYRNRDIGRSKVDVAREFVEERSTTAIAAHQERIAADNALSPTQLIGCPDVILDGCDNFATRLLVADHALSARVPLVSAAVGQFEGQLAVYRGWEADKPCYRCFVGSAPDEGEATCADAGVLGPVTGVLGSLAALEVIRAVVPFGEGPAGKLLLVDTLAWRFRTLALPKDPGCPACGA